MLTTPSGCSIKGSGVGWGRGFDAPLGVGRTSKFGVSRATTGGGGIPDGVGVGVNVGVGVGVKVDVGVGVSVGVAVGGTGVEEGGETGGGIVAVADGLAVAASGIRNRRLTNVTSTTRSRRTTPCTRYPPILRIVSHSVISPAVPFPRIM
jgi:hypothetical protein